jgi:hypothetical protein
MLRGFATPVQRLPVAAKTAATTPATTRIIASARGVLQLYCGPALGMVRGQPEGSRGIHMSRRYLLCVHFNMKAFD